MNKLITIMLCLSIVFSLSGCGDKIIGAIKGAEWDKIVIDEIEYVKVTDSSVSHADKGKYLGKVSDGSKTIFKCYSVKNDDEGKYIYCLWDWEGSVYKKASE